VKTVSIYLTYSREEFKDILTYLKDYKEVMWKYNWICLVLFHKKGTRINGYELPGEKLWLNIKKKLQVGRVA
jgi:hypothetical protein